jgi:hypothetical protein
MNDNPLQEKQIIYAKNKVNNKEKLEFWKFLMYSTKAEIHINSFLSLLFWVSILEIFMYIIGFALFISSPKTYGIFWLFTPHVVRAILGLIILRKVPHSHTVIEELKDCSDDSITDIENHILSTYKNLLSNSESSLRPLLIIYFVFTIIDIIVDNIGFIILQVEWADKSRGLQNFVLLSMVIIFFCKNIVII